MLKNHNNSLNTYTVAWHRLPITFFLKLMMCSIHRVQLLSICRAVLLGFSLLISIDSHAVNLTGLTVDAIKNLTCAGARPGAAGMNCNAGEFTTITTFSAAPGTPPFCVAGQDFNFQVELFLSGPNTDRYDVAFFVGQQGNDPRASTAGGICSVAVFPDTPEPWYHADSQNNTVLPYTSCGDFRAKDIVTNALNTSTTTINEIKVKCNSGDSTGSLTIPYVITYKENIDKKVGDANYTDCRAANVTTGSTSKCNFGASAPVSGAVAVNVGTYIDVTKQTNPDGSSQTFSYTATGPSGSKVIALTGATLTPTSATGGTYTPATIATATNTTTVSISDGQTVRFYMTGLTTSQELKVTEGLATGWEPTPSISCAAVTGAPTFTTPTSPTTPAADIPRTTIVNLDTTNSAAACTFTNTKRPTLRITKISQGGTGTFTFTGDNGWASQGITTAAAGGSGTAGALQALTTSSTATTITEALAAGYTMTGVSCTGMGAGGTVTPNLSAGTFTLDAAATAAGSDIACTVTNAKTPTVKIQKTTVGGVGGPFSFAQTNLASTPADITTTVMATATPSSPTAINVTTIGTDVTLTETPATGFALTAASCTDANAAVTGNVGAIGTLSGNVLTIPATNVTAGADFTCVFTNLKLTTLQLAKAWGTNSSASDSASIGATTGGTNNTTSFSTAGGTAADSGAAVTINVGNTITFAAETGTNIGNYNTVLSCTADGGTTANTLSGTNGQVSNTLVIGAGDSGKAIVCTYTNTRKSATLRLAKAWGVNSIANNVSNIGATTGFVNNTTAFNSTASTASNSNTVTVFAGETATLPAETMSTGTLANYTTTLSCDNGVTPSGTNGQSSNTITIPNTVTGLVTCTYTNTRIAQNLTLVKQWTNAATGHTATVTTTGGTNNSSFNSTAPSTNTTGTTVTVYAGDVVTLPAETFDGGASASIYSSTVACTGGSTLASGAVGRSVTISNSTTATTCTYSNTGLSDMVPTLITYMPNTGIVGSPYYGKFTCTNNGIAPATAGATCAISLPAGLSATCSPTVPTAGTVAVGASINCTVTGTPTTAGSDTLVLTTGATNDSNGGTTTGGNNQVSQAITIVDSTTAPTCSPGSTTNLLSSPGTAIYYDNNTSTPITNSFGLIASPASYVRTGSNFVVRGNWRWRNANPAAGSPAMTYQLIVNGTVYAQLVGTPSGQEVGTLTALNGATLDGGLTSMQLYDFSVSGLAALPVGVTLPSTVTSISTLSMSFVSSTTPADDAGLAPTVLNACALPKLTLSKVSQGGVGAFAFTGNNGFSNETITTTVEGTGVAGTTQTLSAVSTTTTISETIPSGYNVTDISCTGLGSGNATPNLVAGSVAISDSALVYGANIACTYTNTKLPTITISKISQGGVGTFSFTGTNDFASQNITTSSSGVAVAGATQTLSAAATATTITETIPSGYTVTDISCTGLGTGSATPNLVGGSVSLNAAATAAGANIACTFTNTKSPTITISKISQGGVGTFSFTGTNGFASQNITTSSAGVAVAGATQTLSAAATATTITETIPSGYTVTDISCTGLGTGSATPNLVGGSVSLNAAATAAGANIACTFTNTASAFTITGKVFLDNGKNSATPHNGIQEVDEQGIGNALVRLTNCGSTVYQTTTTNGAGSYSLTIPSSLTAGASLCVEEYQQPSNLVSVSGNVGTTGGSYTLATDKIQFTLAAATNYTGVNFGDVVQSQLTGTGNQTIPAGTTASYGHQFIAGTEGSVTFSTAQAPTPLLSWTSLVYLDNNCNAVLDGGDTQITTSINVVADQVVCLVQKVISPSTATNGSQNVSTLSASFVYAAPSAINQSLSQIDTTLIMDSGLVLVKKVREVSSCPLTGADSNVFITNNQALPNALIEYQIFYSNPSANVVSDIVINDMTPSFTTYRSATCHSTPSSVLCSVALSPSVGGVGSLQWHLTDNPVGLGSGQSGEVRFCVRVDQ